VKYRPLLLSWLVFLSLLALLDLGSAASSRMAAVAVLMALLWMTEAVPLAVTALLPLVLFPLLGIAATNVVAGKYMNSTVFLLLGGFLIAQAMERWGLHRRIALTVLGGFGGHPVALLLGFITATSLLSMWISNTASTLVMLPIALAVLGRFEGLVAVEKTRRLGVALLLAIAYSASLGGMMSLVGTPPNLVFARIYGDTAAVEVDFARWLLVGVPLGLAMLSVLAVYLTLLYLRGFGKGIDLAAVLAEERRRLGPVSGEEWKVAAVFAVTAMLWMGRRGIDLGAWRLPGWQGVLAHGDLVDDGTVAIAMAALLFMIPARGGSALLDVKAFGRLPWTVVILFGGGFALASGFTDSGLSAVLASRLEGMGNVSLTGLMFMVAGGMTFLTELTSNTSTTQMILPILASLAKGFEIDPLWLMLPATFSASCAFMFPVATPPNAIVFGCGLIRMRDMIRTGLVLNLIAIPVVVGLLGWLIPRVFL